jgi:hypothetical protein
MFQATTNDLMVDMMGKVLTEMNLLIFTVL